LGKGVERGFLINAEGFELINIREKSDNRTRAGREMRDHQLALHRLAGQRNEASNIKVIKTK
jgi:hypothetical protein